ncbi:MAG: exodeoxyribonuclease VII small subunit [Candidatus Dadabacteria bacterium]|nr:exodeoxyribonuclease VII small subunit [Candidatus Dadabacteria bacterium]NIQ16039.1 exodeoxyribonuclease VII small subunit [Candidatus Dadabacteria bacterium]
MESFEKSLKKINEIVELLESGELSLDESIKKFEEGTKLVKECYQKLESVKKNINIIVEDSNEETHIEEFELDENE